MEGMTCLGLVRKRHSECTHMCSSRHKTDNAILKTTAYAPCAIWESVQWNCKKKNASNEYDCVYAPVLHQESITCKSNSGGRIKSEPAVGLLSLLLAHVYLSLVAPRSWVAPILGGLFPECDVPFNFSMNPHYDYNDPQPWGGNLLNQGFHLSVETYGLRYTSTLILYLIEIGRGWLTRT